MVYSRRKRLKGPLTLWRLSFPLLAKCFFFFFFLFCPFAGWWGEEYSNLEDGQESLEKMEGKLGRRAVRTELAWEGVGLR